MHRFMYYWEFKKLAPMQVWFKPSPDNTWDGLPALSKNQTELDRTNFFFHYPALKFEQKILGAKNVGL